MSAVQVTNVTVLDNPTRFPNPFQFEISYECMTPLEDDLEWKVVYVGSADDETQDQELDSVLVGPVAVGSYRFVFQADAPDPSRIPPEDLLGVTVVLLTCSYRGQEFLRVGYYVNNEYDNEELKENPPSVPMIDRIERSILADKPRVTKFQIRWDDAGAAETMATGTEGEGFGSEQTMVEDGGNAAQNGMLHGAPPAAMAFGEAYGYENAVPAQAPPPLTNVGGFAMQKTDPSYASRGGLGLPPTVPSMMGMEE